MRDIVGFPVRILFAVPRSGSTLFMRIIANNKSIAVTSRTIIKSNDYKTGFDDQGKYDASKALFKPDFGIYSNPLINNIASHTAIEIATSLGYKFLVSKEEIGKRRLRRNETENACSFRPFPDLISLLAVRPAFVFRHPIDCYASWYHLGWTDIESFVDAYLNLVSVALMAKELRPSTVIYLYEDFCAGYANEIMKGLCLDWDVPVISDLSVGGDLANYFLFWHERERQIYAGEVCTKVFETINSTDSIFIPHNKTAKLPAGFVNIINRKITPLYTAISVKYGHDGGGKDGR